MSKLALREGASRGLEPIFTHDGFAGGKHGTALASCHSGEELFLFFLNKVPNLPWVFPQIFNVTPHAANHSGFIDDKSRSFDHLHHRSQIIHFFDDSSDGKEGENMLASIRETICKTYAENTRKGL